jgi:hypothetical protein
MLRQTLMAALAAFVMAGPSAAQQIVIQQRPGGPEPKGEVRVQVNVNFFVSAPMGDAEAAVKAQENARRILYVSAGRECDVLKATLASECRLESVNVNMNRNYGGGNQPEGFTAGGSFAYRVMLK